MSKVHILPPEIVSKIAAGEVIERPASVVKELIENSLDAQTESIEVSLKQAGKALIHIKDTGTGIEPDDIEKIFQRHSTSKIHNIDDLFTICSLGFRGEALYSIASIADITLRSKTTLNDTGWEIHLRNGERLILRPVSMPEGTEVEIKELFFNTPARKKFLKSDTTELHQILNIFIPYAILHPKIRFSLTHHNNKTLDLPPEKDYITRIKKALNLETKDLIEIKKDFSEKNISMHLILGNINIQRTRKDMQFIFINNRPVHNRSINFHLNQIYRLILPSEVHPFFSAQLTIPPQEIDVNIHPTKREVKIKNESTFIPLLKALCEHALMTHGKAKEMKEVLFSYNKVDGTINKEYEKDLYIKETFLPQGEITTPLQQDDLKNKLSNANYIGAFQNKYLFFESGTSLIVIDQHAAQERIIYEQLILQMQSDNIEIQHLLTPFVIKCSPQELLMWENLKDTLEKIGLQTTLWDKENIALHTHPQLIKKPEISIRSILSEKETLNFDIDTIIRHACRNSVMAGDKLSLEEAKYLCKNLIECIDPFTCPHGRPTVIEIKEKIFEKGFLRK